MRLPISPIAITRLSGCLILIIQGFASTPLQAEFTLSGTLPAAGPNAVLRLERFEFRFVGSSRRNGDLHAALAE